MTVFADYARYYDLLYRDKDYQAEAEFIHQLVRRYAPAATSILELGCGTGNHASLLVEKGYSLCGIDQSAAMLATAQQRLAHLPPDQAQRLEFFEGDVRTIRVSRQFDVVISLFHVISYQTTNADLQAAFATAKTHLNPGGILIFDCWYGPAVLSDRPIVRVKRLEDDAIQVTRIAEPQMHPNQNLVDVNYQVFIKDKATGAVADLQETHHMRYLFQPEIERLFAEHRFKGLATGEWLTGNTPGFDTWGVYFVAQA